MEKRIHDLSELRQYTETVENKLNTILQSLNWTQNVLLQTPIMVSCKYDSNHLVPTAKKESHEKLCYLKYHDYSPNDLFLPDIPPGAPGNTVCKLSNNCVRRIVNTAAQNDPLFRRGIPSIGLDNEGPEPLTLDRLQCTYTSDERRAIHDAVVETAPAIHNLSDLALPSGSGEAKDKIKSRLEVLAELRDMKRRRTKYRVPTNTNKYSHVLRELIKTQMEFYTSSAAVKSGDTTRHSKDIEKYSQEDSRSNSRPFQKVEHTYKTSYNSNREKQHNDEPRSTHTNNYSNKNMSKERTHSVKRHNEDSSNYRKSYTGHNTSSKSYNSSSKIHVDKHNHEHRVRRSKHEHRDRDHAAYGRHREDERYRDGEPSRHRKH